MSNIRRMGYLLAAVLAVIALCSTVWKPAAGPIFHGIASAQVPSAVGVYSGVDIPVDSVTRAALPTAYIVQRKFTGSDGTEINVSIIGGTGRNELHDPRSCLLGAGWRIEDDHVEELPNTTPEAPIRSCIAEMSDTPSAGYDILYLYVVDRKIIASASAIRWTLLKSDLLDQSDHPVYFVRAITALPTSDAGPQQRAQEHARLVQFTSLLWKQLSPVILNGERT